MLLGCTLTYPIKREFKLYEKHLNDRCDKTPSTNNLCKLADIILKYSYFEIGDKNFRQISRKAIGVKLPYSTIF